MIECECGHENCGIRHTIYTGGMEDTEKIKARILKLNPAIPCDSHNLVWKTEKIFLEKLPS
jgi:hypothetical protein